MKVLIFLVIIFIFTAGLISGIVMYKIEDRGIMNKQRHLIDSLLPITKYAPEYPAVILNVNPIDDSDMAIYQCMDWNRHTFYFREVNGAFLEKDTIEPELCTFGDNTTLKIRR
mgnify:CR=1 FL=1